MLTADILMSNISETYEGSLKKHILEENLDKKELVCANYINNELNGFKIPCKHLYKVANRTPLSDFHYKLKINFSLQSWHINPISCKTLTIQVAILLITKCIACTYQENLEIYEIFKKQVFHTIW